MPEVTENQAYVIDEQPVVTEVTDFLTNRQIVSRIRKLPRRARLDEVGNITLRANGRIQTPQDKAALVTILTRAQSQIQALLNDLQGAVLDTAPSNDTQN